MPVAPPNAPSGPFDDPSRGAGSPWTNPTKGGIEYTNDASPVPRRIGRYTIIRLIGQGGMGAVYEAEQDQPKRRVALKLIRQAFAGESARVRFQQEAQHLADLDHPAIAKVFEAGTQTQDIGGPIAYIAMEYVHGAEAITRHARKRNLPLRARLELVAQVCDALHHAHERGVIHRDVKPANVVVSDFGQPKVIDFGVARAEMLAGERRPGVTLDGQMVGTLEYMAPEQCLADPNDPNAIDRRTDVYALGLLLYELVVGVLPYDVSRADIPTAINVIRETLPEPPRKSNPDLPRAVETIMLKALRKQREARYATALDMGEDIRRFLRDEPVRARPETLVEQAERAARKTAIRRPVLAMMIDVIIAAMLAWLVAFPLAMYTPITMWYTSALARLSKSPAASTIHPDIEIIARMDSTGNGAALAQSLGIESFDPEIKQSARLLHAKLMARLLTVKPRAVCFDMHFPSDVYAQEFADAARALREAGVPVFITVADLRVRENGLPMVASAILPHVLAGPPTGQFGSEGQAGMDVLLLPKSRSPMYSWVALIFAAVQAPPQVEGQSSPQPEFSLTPDGMLKVGWVTSPIGFPNIKNRVPREAFFPVVPRAANPKDHIGLASDDTVYTMYFQPLPDHAFTNRVTPYERAFELADADFARTFANKCVIIANFNDPVDRFTGEDGVARPGVMYQVSALTAMLRQTPLTVIHDAWSIALPAFAAGAAAILAFLLLPRPTVPRTICLTLGLTILVASASFIGYQSYRLVLEPFTLWAAALLATLGVVLLTTLRARRSI